MTKELYINGQLVDLPKDVIALSYAVNTLNEVKSLNGNVSNRINLPPTSNNIKILGFVGDMNVDMKNIVRKKLTCRYVQNGVEIIPKGVVQIGTITKKGLGIFITSGNVDFFDIIDGSIQDLDFSDYNHTYDFSIIDSRTNREGYIYPVVNYGDMTDATVYVNIATMRPAVFGKTIVEKIVNEAGFRLINLLETHPRTADQYARMILPFSNDDFIHSQRFIDLNKTYEMKVKQSTPRTYTFSGDGVDGTFSLVKFSTVLLDPSNAFHDSGYYLSPAKFLADITVTFPEITFDRRINGASRAFRVELVKKDAFGAVTVLNTFAVTVASGSPTVSTFTNVVLKATGVVVKGAGINEDYYIRVDSARTGGAAFDLIFGVIKPATFTVASVGGKVAIGDNVELEATLPDIAKKDFLKAVANYFGGIIQTNNQDKTVSIVPFFKIVENTPIAVNWSDRIVNETEQSNEVSIGEYGINNIANYNNDDAIEDKDNYAKGQFEINDENLDITKEFFDVPFSASLDSTVCSGIPAIEITKITTTGGNVFETSTEPRIAMVEFVDTQMQWRLNGDAGFTVIQYDSIPTTYFAGLGDRKGLMMQEILDRYYPEIITMLNDQRKKIIPMLLTEVDISALDFFIPVYLEQYASNFYISKIKDFVGNKACNVELIKLY